MDMSDYMSMFLDESRENLQNLNQCLLDLEKNPNNLALLDEIFRVAHTLKGMSATMGFTTVAELTHEMENVLDKLRKGEMPVVPDVVDILFQCLDTLETLITNITNGVEDSIDTSALIKKLRSMLSMDATRAEVASSLAEPLTTEEEPFLLTDELNEFEKEVITQARGKGFQIYRIVVSLEEECLLKAARAFMVFRELEEQGEVIKTIPEVKELEEGEFQKDFQIYLVTKADQQELVQRVITVSEVETVDIVELLLDKSATQSVTENAVEIDKTKQTKPQPVAQVNNNNGNHKNKLSQTVRVDIERLDNLMNLVGELVINRTRLEQIGLKHGLNDLGETLEQVGRITTDLQNLVMKVRMVPIEQVFNRFPRMIRDLAKELGREINLVIEGEETELDRTVIDEIGDPLVHLLRNAVDHGVGSPEEREKMGKSRVGTVKLLAYPEGNQVVIRVDDDGKGINPEIILKKALEKGVITEKEAEKMEAQDIVMLVFKPGFSTAEKVTDVSGRGVGMDVVRTKIESLGGNISVQTKVGEGSSFIIRLPLTLAIIQALLVGMSKEIYAIPLSSIEETISLAQEDIKTIQDKEVILLRGNVLPVLRLSEILQVEADSAEEEQDLYVVVVKTGQRRAGLIVDKLIGQQEVVIKSLGKLLNGYRQFAGATILGDGRVALILDITFLL